MSLENRISNLAFRWGSWLMYSPFTVLLVVVVLSFLAVQYTSTHLSVNTDTAELIAPDAPFQKKSPQLRKSL